MRVGDVALWALLLPACGEGGASLDARPDVLTPEVSVDIVPVDASDTGVPSDTAETTPTPDTIPPRDVPAETTPPRDTHPTDTGAPDTGPVADTTTPPDPATCPTPPFTTQYPAPFPPSPYGEWPPAEGCLAGRHDVIIVLGCPSNDDGSPSRCQERRAEQADWLYESGWADHLIVTGAAVHTPHVEADALSALLIGRGVPDETIVREPLARHTDENIYYATRIMQARAWNSAIVVTDEPGHLMYTGLCDANCCVKLGRMTLLAFAVGPNGTVKAGHYALSPPGPGVTPEECSHLAGLILCTNQDERLACKDDFRLP